MQVTNDHVLYYRVTAHNEGEATITTTADWSTDTEYVTLTFKATPSHRIELMEDGRLLIDGVEAAEDTQDA